MQSEMYAPRQELEQQRQQRQPAAQWSGGPTGQQHANTAQWPGGLAAQQQQVQAQRVVPLLRATPQQQKKVANAAVHLAVQQGQDFVSLACPAPGSHAAALAKRTAPGAKGRRALAAGSAAAGPVARALQPTATQLAQLVGEVKATVVQSAGCTRRRSVPHCQSRISRWGRPPRPARWRGLRAPTSMCC